MSNDWRSQRLFGDRLKALREKRGLSIRELSAQTKLAMSHIQYMEQTSRVPSLRTLQRLAAGLDVGVEQLQ
jgi:transcriptional regulator with XRE-family HTH domain